MNNLMVIDGIEVRRDAYGRYSLNDLHRAAVASGANARTKEPGKFLSSQQITELVQELIDTQNLGVGSFNETTQNLGSKPVSKIEGRNPEQVPDRRRLRLCRNALFRQKQ